MQIHDPLEKLFDQGLLTPVVTLSLSVGIIGAVVTGYYAAYKIVVLYGAY
tara:strand:- start:898 stop:1047 length:150 start_codon:yes stop_codon:yes gene_type:complete